jgi:Putative auto-transporter adhesin, head GIN domain
MRALVPALLALAASPAAAREWGSQPVRGDGKVTVQKRELPAFDAVRLRAAVDVAVKVGQPQSVTVKIDGNLQELLETTVAKGVLVIETRKSIRQEREATVEITMPELRRFALEGSGDVAIEGGKGALDLAIGGSGDLRWRGEASTLDARVHGSGGMRLEGRAETLGVRVEGSGDVDASGLQAVNADARVEGSGGVELSLAGGTLNAAVRGSGDIHWRGETRTERIAVRGSGAISRRK